MTRDQTKENFNAILYRVSKNAGNVKTKTNPPVIAAIPAAIPLPAGFELVVMVPKRMKRNVAN